MCRKQIRGARWQELGGVSSVKQLIWVKVLKSLQDLQLNESVPDSRGANTKGFGRQCQ